MQNNFCNLGGNYNLFSRLMNQQNHLFEKYLHHLDVEKQPSSIKALEQLQTAQIIKFPFENISKLLLWEKSSIDELVDFESHLNNSIVYNCGGTCYSNNYYFFGLLEYIGYEVSILGADMGEKRDIHLVVIVKLDGKRYLLDSGYGAPFYKPIPLDKEQAIEINWSEIKYVLTKEKDDRHKVTVYKNGKDVHGYTINNEERDINHFANVVRNSFIDKAA